MIKTNVKRDISSYSFSRGVHWSICRRIWWESRWFRKFTKTKYPL